jgi:hypothetical protein
MIPDYLKGKSAADIVNEVRNNFIFKDRHTPETLSVEGYCDYLETHLLLAVKDALCNADEVKELIQEGQYNAMGRAIAFLNMVLPYKE